VGHPASFQTLLISIEKHVFVDVFVDVFVPNIPGIAMSGPSYIAPCQTFTLFADATFSVDARNRERIVAGRSRE
jgi:hypothetical protein